MYSGASLTNGYGMQYRENFVHHSLEVPGLHGRGGIYFGTGSCGGDPRPRGTAYNNVAPVLTWH